MDKKSRRTPEGCLKRMANIAEENGGELLSTVWQGVEAKYDFMYSDSTRFSTTFQYIDRIGWPNQHTFHSRRNPEDCLKRMADIAQENGGELLSTVWQGYDANYDFIYSNNTPFSATYKYLDVIGWPNQETYLKTNEDYLKELELIAQENNSKLLSTEWIGNGKKYLFETEEGQQFTISAKNLKSRGWPQDISNHIKLSTAFTQSDEFFIKKIQEISKKNGGKLLSTVWKGKTSDYDFMDMFGNKFSTSYTALTQGQWAPDRGLIAEPACRQAIEHLFNQPFPKTQKVLTAEILNRNKNLELDGYNDKLKIAFEYQGHPCHWDINHKNYNLTVSRDNLKVKTCSELGIHLVIIPPLKKDKNQFDPATLFNHVLENVILSFHDKKIKLPKLYLRNFKLDLTKIHHANEMLNKLRIAADNNNMKLISDEWLGNSFPYLFEAENGTQFNMTATSMKRNRTGKININQLIKTDNDRLEELRLIAQQNNGILISQKWNGSQAEHIFQNENGQIFKRRTDVLKTQGWPKSFTKKNLIKLK